MTIFSVTSCHSRAIVDCENAIQVASCSINNTVSFVFCKIFYRKTSTPCYTFINCLLCNWILLKGYISNDFTERFRKIKFWPGGSNISRDSLKLMMQFFIHLKNMKTRLRSIWILKKTNPFLMLSTKQKF